MDHADAPAGFPDASAPTSGRPSTPDASTGAGPLAEPFPESSPDVTAHLRALRNAADALVAIPVEALDAPDAARVHDELRAACDRLRAFGARVLAHIETDGRWAASGNARFLPEWVARRGGVSVGTARREVALGKALSTDLPSARQAVADGRMSLEHAEVLSRFAPTSEARRSTLASADVDRNEAFLVAAAARVGVDDFRKIVRHWAADVDEAAHEAEHADACAREYLVVARRAGGVDLQGFLAGEHAETLMTALRAVAGVPAADDPRSAEQRRAQALTDLAGVALDRGLAGGGRSRVRPHISVLVSWETMQRLAREHPEVPSGHDSRVTGVSGTGHDRSAAAELDDGTPIPPSVLARIACDSEISRIVFGPAGQPLDIGRTLRTYAGPLRRAVIARDRHCQYPGCGAPPTLGEVHHVRWWVRDGGRTSVENGILLCYYHHQVVHQRNLGITANAAGGWEFRCRDGRPVTTGSAGPPGTTGIAGPPGTTGIAEPPGTTSDPVPQELALAG
jgi:hypothetical protein